MGVLGHGFRCRLGLTPDRFGRQVLEFAALPGLAIASALAAFLFIWGEWIPRHAVPPLGPHFGRFVTVAPIACLVWVLCFTYAIGAPQHRRAAAALAVGSIGAAVVVGKLVGLSPNIAQMGILIGLGLPGVLASTDRPSSRQVAGSLGAGLIAFGVLWWLGVTPGSRFVSFYWYGNWAFTRDLVLVALATFVGAVGLAASGRRVLAWAVVLLASPFVLSPVHVIKSFRSSWMPHWVTTRAWFTVLITACGLPGLVVLWLLDQHGSVRDVRTGESTATLLGLAPIRSTGRSRPPKRWSLGNSADSRAGLWSYRPVESSYRARSANRSSSQLRGHPL